jgi:hypothetical protein
MTQNVLPFQYEINRIENNLTSFAGLPLYMDLANVIGLTTSIEQSLQTKTQGWNDSQSILSLIMLNLAGGDCLDDIERLQNDEGLTKLLLKAETYGMKRSERRAYERQFRKSKKRALPSTSSLRRYLEQFHHAEQEELREEGKAFIPEQNKFLQALVKLNDKLIEFSQKQQPHKTATLDQDATLSETAKRSALYCYEKYKAYQPFNTYWSEQNLVIHSEFRDGNVPAGFEQLRLLKEAIDVLPASVEKVFLRSDSAGYQQDLLKYCASAENKRFGVIEFAIAAKVTQAFKIAVAEASCWKAIYKEDVNGNKIKTNQEWSEVCFVPNFLCQSNDAPALRYLAIREPMAVQETLPGIDPIQKELPFQTLTLSEREYKIFGVVTNRDIDGEELIHWHRERCGQSEKIHSIEKTELTGGQFPSNKFGANAAWWQIMVLSLNLHNLMKQHALPEHLKTKGMKSIRYHIIGVAGRLIKHARGFFIRLSGGLETAQLLYAIREKVLSLISAPEGISTA